MTLTGLIEILDQIRKEIINECVQAAIDTGKPDTYHLTYAKHKRQLERIEELKANVLAGDTSIIRKIRAVLVKEIAKTKERKPKGEKLTEAKRRGTIKPARLGKKIQKEQEKPAGDVEQKAGSRKV
jgi:hypothetical protein